MGRVLRRQAIAPPKNDLNPALILVEKKFTILLD